MKLREKIKRFWTLDVHNHEGFTLVELIIVIAILAILSSVAVVGYSSYVAKANKQADETLLAEIEHAIYMAYYSNPDFEYGYLALSSTEDASATGSVAEAMEAAFGSGWKQTLRLKTSDWTASYKNSSFNGKETALLGKVDSLTDTLSGLLASMPGLVGEDFSAFLTEIGISNETGNEDAVADAAVLYVAQNAVQAANREDIVNVMVHLTDYEPGQAANALVPAFGGSYVAAAAGLYAISEAYCQYENSLGNPKPLQILNEQSINTDGITSTNQIQAVFAVLDAFGAVANEVYGDDSAKYHTDEYFSETGKVVQDTYAYLDMMSTVNSAQNEIVSNTTLGTENYFTTSGIISEMFQLVADGGILVYAREDENGDFVVEFSCVHD